MTLQENIKSAYALKKEREELEAQIATLQAKISEIDAKLGVNNNDIMALLKEGELTEVEIEGLFANLFTKHTVGYTSESDAITWLKNNGYASLVKVKTTESLDKNAIKKAMKTDTALTEGLNSITVDKVTEYVVVTDAENHAKMLEHIEENIKK